MKIISPFRDFYDSALAYGHDDHVVYVRKSEELYNANDPVLRNNKQYESLFSRLNESGCEGYNKSSITFNSTQILFCGKMYRGIRVTMKSHWSIPQVEKTDVYYHAEALEKAVRDLGGSLDLDRQARRRYWWNDSVHTGTVREWLSQQGIDSHYDYAIENRFVAVVADPTTPARVINNPRLASYDFYRVMNPVIAYQEIDMYLSGVLPQSSIITAPTPDKYKIQAHGFDKQSFRKSPTKHR